MLTFESTNTHSSEFTTISTLTPGPDSSSAGLTSASTTVEMTIEGLETTTGTLTTIENPGSLVPPPNTISTEGETTTTGNVTSTFHYEETGTSSDSYTNAPYDVDMTSNFAIELDSTTDIDILSTETSTSEWTLLNYGDEEEEIEIVGFAITNIDGVTTLDYDSDFGFVMSTTVESSGTNSNNEVLTSVLSTSVSQVDSTHTTHDTYQVERELVEGEVVETSDRDYTGSFLTEALQTSSTTTDVEGEFHYETHPYTWPGPGPGPSTDIEAYANQTFEDHRQTTTTMSAEQSGSYGDGEEDSSSSEFSITSADEYYSDMAGDHYWEPTTTGIVMEGSYTSHEEGSSERVFAETKDFTSEGNSATWNTSFERERSWEVHTEGVTYGYATIVDDSGSESYSESSGGQTYEPGDDDNPSNGYDGGGGFETHGDGGGDESNETGDGNTSENGVIAFGDPSYQWLILIRNKSGDLVLVPLSLLEWYEKYQPWALEDIRILRIYAFTPEELTEISKLAHAEFIRRVVEIQDSRFAALRNGFLLEGGEQFRLTDRRANEDLENRINRFEDRWLRMEQILIGARVYGLDLSAWSNPGLSDDDWDYYNDNYDDYLREKNRLERDRYYGRLGIDGKKRRNDEYYTGRWSHHPDMFDINDIRYLQANMLEFALAYAAGRTGTLQPSVTFGARSGSVAFQGGASGYYSRGGKATPPRNLAELRDRAAQHYGHKKHATYIAGSKDGETTVGRSGICGCAEDHVTQQLGQGARFTHAYGWRTNKTTGKKELTLIPVCVRCQAKYQKWQFPPDVRYDSPGPWSQP